MTGTDNHNEHDHDDLKQIVDDDGHTLADITPWPIEEPDETTIQAELHRPEDPTEHANWDRSLHGGMWEYATDHDLTVQSGDDCEKGV